MQNDELRLKNNKKSQLWIKRMALLLIEISILNTYF